MKYSFQENVSEDLLSDIAFSLPAWISTEKDMVEYIYFLQMQVLRATAERSWLWENGKPSLDDPKFDEYLNMSASYNLLYTQKDYERSPHDDFDRKCFSIDNFMSRYHDRKEDLKKTSQE